MPARRVLLIIVALALLLSFIPFKSLNCPDWDVWVVDQAGQPVAGMTVRLSYRNYSAEDISHEADQITDQRGHASFGAQMLSATVARRFATIFTSALAGVHASFGPHASVFAFGKGLEGFDVDLQKNIVVNWTADRAVWNLGLSYPLRSCDLTRRQNAPYPPSNISLF